MRLRAVSIDRELKDSLAGEGIAGSTLAVYDRAVYLRTDDGPIVVVGPAAIGNGPGFILLDHDGPLRSGRPSFHPGERFEAGGGLVRIGGDRIIIETDQGAVWDPLFSPGEAYSRRGLAACMEMVRGMAQSRDRGSLAPAVREKARSLADALAKDCEMDVRPAARGLIGLGEGLTPACDDLLVGLVGFMRGLIGDPSIGAYAERIISWIGEELAAAGGRTTPIAAHFLAEAGRGRFTERVEDMLEAIFAADEKRMERAMERLIEYGATSGLDLMWGMVLGYEAVK